MPRLGTMKQMNLGRIGCKRIWMLRGSLDGFIKSVIEKAGATKGSDSDPSHALGPRRDKTLAEIATEYPSKIVKPFETLESLKT